MTGGQREGEEAQGRRHVLPVQWVGFPGWLLPAPEACLLLLEKEPPSSWPFPFAPPWEFMATKLSAAPRDTVAGMEQDHKHEALKGRTEERHLLSLGTLEVEARFRARCGDGEILVLSLVSSEAESLSFFTCLMQGHTEVVKWSLRTAGSGWENGGFRQYSCLYHGQY